LDFSAMQQTRSEPRTGRESSVRIFGLDSSGNPINSTAWTVDISRRGVRLKGINFRVKPGETIGLRSGPEKARYKVVWIGDPASPLEGQIGLFCLESGKYIWSAEAAAGEATPATGATAGAVPAQEQRPPVPTANHLSGPKSRRKEARYRTSGGAKVQEPGAGAAQWTMLHDISLGGCYVETSTPLRQGARVEVAVHAGDIQIVAKGEVTLVDRMVGMGVRFTELSPLNRQRLERLVTHLVQSGAALA
jgi:hypothetical protein